MVLVLRLLIYGIITEVADKQQACGNTGTTTSFKRPDGITIICLPLQDTSAANIASTLTLLTNKNNSKHQRFDDVDDEVQQRSLTLRITPTNPNVVINNNNVEPSRKHHQHHQQDDDDDDGDDDDDDEDDGEDVDDDQNDQHKKDGQQENSVVTKWSTNSGSKNDDHMNQDDESKDKDGNNDKSTTMNSGGSGEHSFSSSNNNNTTTSSSSSKTTTATIADIIFKHHQPNTGNNKNKKKRMNKNMMIKHEKDNPKISKVIINNNNESPNLDDNMGTNTNKKDNIQDKLKDIIINNNHNHNQIANNNEDEVEQYILIRRRIKMNNKKNRQQHNIHKRETDEKMLMKHGNVTSIRLTKFSDVTTKNNVKNLDDNQDQDDARSIHGDKSGGHLGTKNNENQVNIIIMTDKREKMSNWNFQDDMLMSEQKQKIFLLDNYVDDYVDATVSSSLTKLNEYNYKHKYNNSFPASLDFAYLDKGNNRQNEYHKKHDFNEDNMENSSITNGHTQITFNNENHSDRMLDSYSNDNNIQQPTSYSMFNPVAQESIHNPTNNTAGNNQQNVSDNIQPKQTNKTRKKKRRKSSNHRNYEKESNGVIDDVNHGSSSNTNSQRSTKFNKQKIFIINVPIAHHHRNGGEKGNTGDGSSTKKDDDGQHGDHDDVDDDTNKKNKSKKDQTSEDNFNHFLRAFNFKPEHQEIVKEKYVEKEYGPSNEDEHKNTSQTDSKANNNQQQEEDQRPQNKVNRKDQIKNTRKRKNNKQNYEQVQQSNVDSENIEKESSMRNDQHNINNEQNKKKRKKKKKKKKDKFQTGDPPDTIYTILLDKNINHDGHHQINYDWFDNNKCNCDHKNRHSSTFVHDGNDHVDDNRKIFDHNEIGVRYKDDDNGGHQQQGPLSVKMDDRKSVDEPIKTVQVTKIIIKNEEEKEQHDGHDVNDDGQHQQMVIDSNDKHQPKQFQHQFKHTFEFKKKTESSSSTTGADEADIDKFIKDFHKEISLKNIDKNSHNSNNIVDNEPIKDNEKNFWKIVKKIQVSSG